MTDRNPELDDTETEETEEIQETEYDREVARLGQDTLPPGEPGIEGAREDVDRDDAQTRASSSHPMLGHRG